MSAPHLLLLTDVGVIVNGTLQLEQRQVIFECGRIVVSMHHNASHVLCHRPLGLQFTGNVEFAENRDQRGKEAVCGRRGEYIMMDTLLLVLAITYPG